MRQRALTYLAGLLTGLLAGGILWLVVSKPRGVPIELKPPPSAMPLRVHVVGEVANPGVYPLAPGAIVQEALDAAGGPTSRASLEDLNLADRLEDGQQIRVRAVMPTGAATPLPEQAVSSTAGLLDINSATLPELDRLPGIGPSLANEILAYRNAHGPFHRVDDLLSVPGIGPSKLASLRDLVTVR